MIWWIIGATTAIAPLGLLVFRKYIQGNEAGRD
jgi:hypothetical protein